MTGIRGSRRRSALHAALRADAAARELGGPAASTAALGRLAPESRVPPDIQPYTLDAVYRAKWNCDVPKRSPAAHRRSLLGDSVRWAVTAMEKAHDVWGGASTASTARALSPSSLMRPV